MISDDIRKSITDWAKKRDRENADTLVILAIDYIERFNIDWNTPSGKERVISYLEEFYYGESTHHIPIKDDWIGHQPNTSPFDLSMDENFTPELTDDTERPKDTEFDTINYADKIDNLFVPIEVKEILKEREDKAYKSNILTNLGTHGRLKLIRKAKIMIFLHNQPGKR
jgi:hypothetical protein